MKVVREIGSVDVAIMLDTSPDNVNYMARKGILPGYKVRKFWRFSKPKIVRWIKKHQPEVDKSLKSRTL